MANQSWMRAAHRDREETVEILRCAYMEGRLNSAELDERAETAFQARTLGELRGLIADIPPRSPAIPLPSGVPWQPRAPRRPRRSASGRSPRGSLHVLLVALAGVVTGAAMRDSAVIPLAVLAGCVAEIPIRN